MLRRSALVLALALLGGFAAAQAGPVVVSGALAEEGEWRAHRLTIPASGFSVEIRRLERMSDGNAGLFVLAGSSYIGVFSSVERDQPLARVTVRHEGLGLDADRRLEPPTQGSVGPGFSIRSSCSGPCLPAGTAYVVAYGKGDGDFGYEVTFASAAQPVATSEGTEVYRWSDRDLEGDLVGVQLYGFGGEGVIRDLHRTLPVQGTLFGSASGQFLAEDAIQMRGPDGPWEGCPCVFRGEAGPGDYEIRVRGEGPYSDRRFTGADVRLP